MTLELTVVAGTSVGHRQRFEQDRIAIGRHPSSDFRFDAEKELEVSARHAEIRHEAGSWLLSDSGSTNGTFVNGHRILADATLYDGDVITLGAHGPQITVRTSAPGALGAARPDDEAMPSTRVSSAVASPVAALGAAGAGAPRARRRGSVALMGAGAAVLLAVGAGAWWMMNGRGTTTVPSPAAGTAEQMGTTAVAAPTGFESVSRENGAAIAFMASELNGRPFGGTAFGVTPSGLLVTNRHLVVDGEKRATRVMVKFADTQNWLPAHVVSVAGGEDDLALVQVDVPGTYPTVRGISSAPVVAVGSSVASIGFPLGTDLPMDGEGDTAVARSTLTAGTVSKRLAGLLQLDSFAGHGSSGSPVFDGSGMVVGVIWGGPRESGGRIVYAVPSDRVVALLPEGAKQVVK